MVPGWDGESSAIQAETEGAQHLQAGTEEAQLLQERERREVGPDSGFDAESSAASGLDREGVRRLQPETL